MAQTAYCGPCCEWGQQPLSQGHGAELRRKLHCLQELEALNREKAGIWAVMAGGTGDAQQNKAQSENCLLHTLPVILVKINYFLYLGQGIGK